MSDATGATGTPLVPTAVARPMNAEEAAAHNARAAVESAARGFRHWTVIGLGLVVLIIVYLSVR